jgi:hypothetical protein
MTWSGEYSLHFAPEGQRGLMPKKSDEKIPYLLAVLLALVVRRYGTERIARRKGSRAITEATGRRHRASIAADIWIQTFFLFFFVFSLSVGWKGGLDADVKTPNNNRGMTYQTDRKELNDIYEHSLRRDNLVNDHITINYWNQSHGLKVASQIRYLTQ